MTIVAETQVPHRRPAFLPLRFALRELRGGLRGFYVFIACIALGVMAIAGVGSVAASLGEGLAREGRALLGGDVAFSLIQREAKPEEVALLRSRGQVSVAATLRGMARSSDGRFALVEMKAVDGNYPMLGRLAIFSARARVKLSSSSRATTWLTMPSVLASAAPIASPVNSISLALRWPTS